MVWWFDNQLSFLHLFLLSSISLTSEQSATEIIIGGIFPRDHTGTDSPEHRAFKVAIDFMRTIPQNGVVITGLAEFADPDDEFEDLHKAIRLVNAGAIAIIGPMEVYSIETTQRLCRELQIPQVAPLSDGLSLSYNPCNFRLLTSMSPGSTPLLKTTADLIKHFGWSKVAILASRDPVGQEGLADFETFLAPDVTITTTEYFYVLDQRMRGSLRMLLRLISTGTSRVIVLKCHARYVNVVMEIAREKEMLEDWVWILTDPALDENHLLHSGKSVSRDLVGVIGVRQSTGKGLYSKSITKYWANVAPDKLITVSVGRLIDSVIVISKAAQDALRDGLQVSSQPAHLMCNLTRQNPQSVSGYLFSSYIRKVRTAGFMNFLSFNQGGYPEKSSYDIVNLKTNGLDKVGEWTPKGGIVMEGDKKLIWMSGTDETPRDTVNVLANKTIRIVSFKGSPFTMPVNVTNNDGTVTMKFEGAVIDLLNRLKEILHFEYEIYMSPDGKVGVENEKTGRWNGVVHELMEGRADLAVGPITITSHRWKAVEFTQPFMTSGLGVVMATANSPKPYFRFLEPFQMTLWVTIFCAVVGMGVVNWFFSISSPFGFYGRCVQALNPGEVKESYRSQKYYLSFMNSIWSSAAYYLGQGPDGNHPVSASGRMAVAVWWFAITILGATYTANMAAFLTTTRMQTPIRRVEDLATQTEIAYGTVQYSQTQNFFQFSHVPRYQMMWEYVKLRRGLVSDTQTGIQRVLRGKYAFIHDAPVLEYLARKNYCGQMKLIGGTFGHAHYGFALPKKSPYTNLLSVEILKLVMSGEANLIIQKWMIDKTPCKPLDDVEKEEASSTDTNKMGVENMLGVFVFMLGGISIGALLLVLEWIAAASKDMSRRKSQNQFVGFWKAIVSRIVRSWKYRGRIANNLSRQTHEVTFKASKATQTPRVKERGSPASSVYNHRAVLSSREPSVVGEAYKPVRQEYKYGTLRRSGSVEV